MVNEASELGYELVIYNVENDVHREHYFNRLPMIRRVDGLIIASLSPDDSVAQVLLRNNLPTVLIDCYNPHLTSIVVNNVDGAYQAVKKLIELGHRRIGFINGIIEGNFKFNQANDRLIGVHMAMAEAGIQFDPVLMAADDWNRAGGRNAACQLLGLPNPPTAIFAASDVQAVGVMEVARQRGISIPEDLSLIGFDGVELSEIMGLTTIQQPMQQMGKMGIQRLMNSMENNHLEPQLTRLDTHLIERNTTAKPASLNSAI